MADGLPVRHLPSRVPTRRRYSRLFTISSTGGGEVNRKEADGAVFSSDDSSRSDAPVVEEGMTSGLEERPGYRDFDY